MKRKRKEKLFLAAGGILLTGFFLWTVLIQSIDVQTIGPNGTAVGLASCNAWFHALTGVHMKMYVLTDWLGIVPILVCFGFAMLGLIQWIQRKNILKVDCDILILGIFYLIVILGYFFFEMIPVNYRPVLIEGRLEASYPSTTTLLVCCVMPTLTEQIARRMRDGIVRKLLIAVTMLFLLFMIIGRLFAGVHWITDIIGALLFGSGAFLCYCGFVMLVTRAKKKQEE